MTLARHFFPYDFLYTCFSPHHSTWRCAAVLPVSEHARPVHPHVADACRELVRVFESSPVCNGPGVKEHHIGVTAGTEQTPVAQSEPPGDRPAHLADGVLQRQQPLLANVLRQHTRIGAICAWVRRSEFPRPGRIHATCIGRDLHPWLL